MAFKKPRQQPQFADLKGILAQTKAQTESSLYQTIEVLIDRLTQFQQVSAEELFNALNESGNQGLRFATRFATFLTEEDETANLPNSRQLIAGTNITFDTTVDGEFTINASGGAAGAYYDSPLSDGDLVQAELIFGNGDPIICQVPNVP